MSLPWLDPHSIGFPPVEQALAEPDGLLAAGGDLTPEWLLSAYQQGIFPWYEEGQPILWWSPDPRLVLRPEALHVSRSLRKLLRKQTYRVTMDRDFPGVIAACAEPRRESSGTWITDDMQAAYCRFHEVGYAHSVEVWEGAELVGGLYGVAIGEIFFGESMFSRQTDTSKVAMVYLARQLQCWGYRLIDCQVASPHLRSLGAVEIPRREFLLELNRNATIASKPGSWQLDERLNVIDHED